jgi:hypothetical protein
MPTFTVSLTDEQAAALTQINLMQENAARRSPQHRKQNLSQLSLAEYVTALITGPANESLKQLTEEKAYAIAQQVISTVNALSIAELDAMAAKIQAEPGAVQEAANLFVEHLRDTPAN